MKSIVIALCTSFALTSPVLAASSRILDCRVDGKDWTSAFILDAHGAGFLIFSKAGGREVTCGLKLESIEDQTKGLSPLMRADFSRGACDPELEHDEREVLTEFSLIARVRDETKPTATVQWLATRKPDACRLQSFALEMLQAKAKELARGN